MDRLALAPEAVLDFSVNGNPYGPSPRVREALAQVPYDRYPDREALALGRELAMHLDVTVDQILVGNGSTELVWLVALAFVRAGDTVLLVGPTFGEYRVPLSSWVPACVSTPPSAPRDFAWCRRRSRRSSSNASRGWSFSATLISYWHVRGPRQHRARGYRFSPPPSLSWTKPT